MLSADGISVSSWCSGSSVVPETVLSANAACDVCIVGAGMSGLTTAWQLVRAGHRVVVIDAAYPGAGVTSRSTAHVTTAVDGRYAELEKIHGPDKMKMVASSLKAAIEELLRVTVDGQIDCGFQQADGYLVQAPDDVRENFLEQEEAAAQRAGLSQVKLTDRVPVEGFPIIPALRFPGQAQFDPVRYISGLYAALRHLNAQVYSRTKMVELKGRPGRWVVHTQAGHTISAGQVVMATNAPINHRLAMHTKQAAYRTFAIALQIPAGSMPRVQVWDTGDPYHYVRIKKSNDPQADLLIVGGEDHRTGQANDAARRYADLEQWARDRFLFAGAVTHRWSGQILEPADGLPFIGRDPTQEGVYLVTGDSGQGTSHALIAGMMIRDLIGRGSHPWQDLYDPGRKIHQAGALREFVRDQANVAAQYADYVSPGEVDHVDKIPPGSGAIVRHGLHKEAVYRDESGVCHHRSAICPHLGGIVAWNDGEKTWDCPCHGSRFSAMGQTVEAPAISGLPEVG